MSVSIAQIPVESEFQQKVIKYGEIHHLNRLKYISFEKPAYVYSQVDPISKRKVGDILLGSVYYDAGSGYYDMADYLASATSISFYKEEWGQYAELANDIYIHWLENMKTPYNAQGFRNFSGGLYREYINSGDLDAKLKARSVIAGIRNNSAYSHLEPTSYANSVMKHEVFSREIAYMLQVLLDYEKAGAINGKSDALLNNKRINLAKNAVLIHLNTWISQQYSPNPPGYLGKNYKYTQAFMVGLSTEAIIDYLLWLKDRREGLVKKGYHKDSFFTKGSTLQTYDAAVTEIHPVLMKMANWLWDNMWQDSPQSKDYGAFKYVNVAGTAAGNDTNPAGDLNMIILPLYIYLYEVTKEPVWLERADKIFIGGVKLAQWNLPKQYNQQTRSVKKYLKICVV